MKNYKIEQFSFNNCSHLSDEEKHNLIKLYTDLEQSIKTIECYSQSTAMKEKRLIVDQKAIDTFKKHPALMYITYFNSNRNSSHSLAKDLLHARCFESIKYMLNDPTAPLIANEQGFNLGMLCVLDGSEELVMLALDNVEARKQVSKLNGDNIGTLAASRRMPSATTKALGFNEVAIHQNDEGENIGMICARVMAGCPAMQSCFELSALNRTASTQQNKKQQTMFAIAEKSGYNPIKLRKKFADLYLKSTLDGDLTI